MNVVYDTAFDIIRLYTTEEEASKLRGSPAGEVDTAKLLVDACYLPSGGDMRILVVEAGLLGKEIAALLSVEHEVIGASRKGSTVWVEYPISSRFYPCTSKWARLARWYV